MAAMNGIGRQPVAASSDRDALIDSLRERRDNGAKQKLQKLVDFDEEHAARI